MEYVVYNEEYLKPLTALIRTHIKFVPPYVEGPTISWFADRTL